MLMALVTGLMKVVYLEMLMELRLALTKVIYLAMMMALVTGLMKASGKVLQMVLSTAVRLEATKAPMTVGLMEQMKVQSMAETMASQ